MKLILKLLAGQMLRHPARFVVTSLAIVAASCVVIWVVSGYDALTAQFDDFAGEYLGRYQLFVAQAVPNTNFMAPPLALPSEVLQEMGRDSAIAALDAESHLRVTVTKPGEDARPQRRSGPAKGDASSRPGRSGSSPPGSRGAGPPVNYFGPPPSPTLVGANANQPPYEMVAGRWISASDKPEGVISQRAATALNIALGDAVLVKSEKQSVEVLVVGIITQVRSIGGGRRGSPGPSRGPAVSALYVPVRVVEQLQGSEPAISIAQIVLKPDVEPSEFKARWDRRLAQLTPPLAVLSTNDVESDLVTGRAAAGARNQAYSATGISLLAALFIIFTALSMGVHERARQFAVLRAVSLTRGQIGVLIAAESLILGLLGWAGGLASGWGLLTIMSQAQPNLFPNGAELGPWCVVLSGVCALGGALAASVFPAWRAMRISPVEAMSVQTREPSNASTVWMSAVGLLLILINPLLVFAWPMPDDSRYGVFVAVGCSAMAVGFLLLAPLAIRFTERWFGPLVARLLGLNPRLVANELSSNMWRTLGTSVALTLGLGLFVATQIWGYSMLQPFVPGTWTPDLMVNFTTGGLPDEEFASVANTPGINPAMCLPLSVEQPKLAADLTHSAERSTVARQDNVILIGLDPGKGIAGPDPLLKLDFVAGTAESAAVQLATGRHVIVPDHFAREAGLKLGDKFAVIPPEAEDAKIEYAVAGIVKLPGWHWMTKFSGVRRRSGRSAAMVFGDFATIRRDYGLKQINFFWAQRDHAKPLEETGAALQAIADRFPGERQPVNAQGAWTYGAVNFGDTVRLSTPEEVRFRIGDRADGMIWGMSQLPLVTLGVAALGVLNTILASVRSRMWNIGVMRAVGLTGFGLARLVFAECIMVGLVACLLSLAFGVLAGWCGAGISQYVSFFGGLNPSLYIPWTKVLFGFGCALALCALAALWPAVSVARQEPLRLLQAGRAAG